MAEHLGCPSECGAEDDAVLRKQGKFTPEEYEAFAIIEQDSGTHFDPELAAVFLQCRPQLETFYRNAG